MRGRGLGPVEMVYSPLSLTVRTRPLRRRQSSQEVFAVEMPKLEIQMTPFPKPTVKTKMIFLSKIEGRSSRHVFHESVVVNLGQKMIVISWIRGRKRRLGTSPIYEASARVVSVSG